MEKLNFTAWLAEVADFGFDHTRPPINRNSGNDPVYPFRLQYIIEQLRKHKVGKKHAHEGFLTDAHWGDGFGAVRVNFTPAGGLRASIQRSSIDSQGKSVWICKRVVEINQYLLKFPDALISEIIDAAREIDREDIEVGVTNFKNLEHLTTRLSNYLDRKMTQTIFIYEGIREVKADREYIIHWGVTGMGVQRQDQQRLDQYQVVVKYDEETGLIKIASLEVGGPIQGHRWQVDPCDFLEFFSPSQPISEICDSVLVHVNSY